VPRRGASGQSAVVGMVGAAALAVGYLLLSLNGNVFENLESLLFGSIFAITRDEVLTLAIAGAGAAAFVMVVGRPLLFASVDPSLAAAARVPVRGLAVAFLFVLGLAVAATAQITGVLLVFALLLAPAAIARELTVRVGVGLALSVLLALAIAWVGLGLSYFTNYPPGFFVTSIALLLFAAARLVSRPPLGRRRGPRGIGAGHAHHPAHEGG
jgi:zinc/manganese transport system permease protein